jgi:plasmid stabilization system protein ParE
MEHKLKYPIVYTARAEKDLVDSFTWYEQQQKGLGARFIDAVKYRIHAIEENPELFAIKFKSYREASIPVFPYVVIYRIIEREKIIRVYSVFHTAKNTKRKYR